MTGFISPDTAIRYPTKIKNEKLTVRKAVANHLWSFLPEMLKEKRTSISQPKITKGKPRSTAISENLASISIDMYSESKALITACPQIP
jgi:hypothetical protein